MHRQLAGGGDLTPQLGQSEIVPDMGMGEKNRIHWPAAMAALDLGKPVYCQKPLTHAVAEARTLRLAAARQGLPTQMGIQIQASATYRRAVAIIRGGAIGKVHHVHALGRHTIASGIDLRKQVWGQLVQSSHDLDLPGRRLYLVGNST